MAMPFRGQIMGRGMDAFQIDPALLEAIENNLRWAESIPSRMRKGMDDLVRVMSLVNLGYAQKYAAGPVDPQQRMSGAAWKLPVRRISGKYYFGWKVRRRGLGTWQLYNDSREAFYIEFGIHRNPRTGGVSPGRIRRPIQKLSLIRTLKFLHSTAVYDRVWASVYMPPPGQRRGRGFVWRMQSPVVQSQIFPTGSITNNQFFKT